MNPKSPKIQQFTWLITSKLQSSPASLPEVQLKPVLQLPPPPLLSKSVLPPLPSKEKRSIWPRVGGILPLFEAERLPGRLQLRHDRDTIR
ncbi:hypothetical protein SDJN03_27185, partial [Cucurbita argyrosperma subsp. sororia]